MKKSVMILLFVFFINYSFCQDISLFIKLHNVSTALGIVQNNFIDTTLIKTRKDIANKKVSEQQLYLLRAAECFNNKDYENSSYYIRKVSVRFKYADYTILKYIVLIGCYANLKDINTTAKFFYIVNNAKLVDPVNMQLIKKEIKNNFNKENFDKALSYYYYYHDRLKIIDEIKFN